MNKEILLLIGVIATAAIVNKLAFASDSYIHISDNGSFLNFSGTPDHLMPPSLLNDGDTIIVYERHLNLNTLSFQMNFL